MKIWRPSSQLVWILLIPAILLSLVAAAAVMHREVSALQSSHRNLADSLNRQLARASHLALLASNNRELRELAETVTRTSPIMGSVVIRDDSEQVLAEAAREPIRLHGLDHMISRLMMFLSANRLDMQYEIAIPPPGEGTLLDPFGTPRAEVGEARLNLSEAYYRAELAAVFYRAATIWTLLFALLFSTGYVMAWLSARPLNRLRRGLRELTGYEPGDHGAREGYEDLEHSLAALGRRLNLSETRAREATEALRSHEQQVDLARDHEKGAARMRADLVAGMSHELRAPLTAILSHAELLSRGALDMEQRDSLDTVHKSARNLLHLIDDVLEWSGIEAGKANLNEVGFNLAETVEDTLTLMAPLAYEKDLELVHLIYQDVPLRLRGDPQRFQQILTNLVSNAIKFTREGGITVRVMLEDDRGEEVWVRASVSDTGPGISEDAQKKLFTMYERLGNKAPGTGLGLAISKRLLEMMGGQISVTSQLGEGSEFEFTLPLKKALHREQNAVPWSGLRDRHLAVIEPHDPARHALLHHLDAWQVNVQTLRTMQELRDRLEDRRFKVWPDGVIIGASADYAADDQFADLLARCREARLPVLTLLTSIDKTLHEAMIAAGASASSAKSINRLSLYRKLCELALPEEADETPKVEKPLQDLQVLVADNSAATRAYVAAMLSGLGAAVAQAEDGEAAVDAWRKGNFPLVLLDDQMPGYTGEQAARILRDMATAANQPLLIGMTADSRQATRDRLLDAGMDAFLPKPFDDAKLLRCLKPFASRLHAPVQATGEPVRQHQLVADPELAKLLAQELPRQLDAVEKALSRGDLQEAQAEIHTLHGTAAFYGLTRLKQIAAQVETSLQDGLEPATQDASTLRAAVDDAIAGLQATDSAVVAS